MDNVQELIKTLKRREWNNPKNYRYASSNTLLLQEHVRRLLIWRSHINLKSANIWHLDLARTIEPELELPNTILNDIWNLDITSPYMKSVFRSALHWAKLADSQHEATFKIGLPKPYQAMILMFARGGSFTIDKSHIEIRSGNKLASAITLSKFLPKDLDTPIVNLDLETLNRIDNEAQNE